MQCTIAVTGANGFVGRYLVAALAAMGFRVKALCRNLPQQKSSCELVEWLRVPLPGDMEEATAALHGAQVVIHLAARAHVLHETAVDPQAEFLRVNRDITIMLAQAAVRASVHRFVYLSSIGVNGNVTHGVPFTEKSPFNPITAYALSKQKAERSLQEYVGRVGLGTVIIRPPLIYGPGVKGNVLRLLQVVHRGVLLPFGSVNNRRSLVGVQNLVDFVIQASIQENAMNKILTVADGEPISTPALISMIAKLMHKKIRFIRIPKSILRVTAKLAGKTALYQQLCESLEIDDSWSRGLIGWRPSISIHTGLAEMVAWFLDDVNASRIEPQ